MTSFKCPSCGQIHDGFPMDMEHRFPADFYRIPEDERETRIRYSADIIVIDENEFYIRGILPVPVIEPKDEFRFGVWARIDEKDMKTYLMYWKGGVPKDLPPIFGLLSGGVAFYPTSDLLEVQVVLQEGNQRPIFIVQSEDNPLGVAQKAGITMAKVHEFMDPLMNGA